MHMHTNTAVEYCIDGVKCSMLRGLHKLHAYSQDVPELRGITESSCAKYVYQSGSRLLRGSDSMIHAPF
jgi:hypothetical protein